MAKRGRPVTAVVLTDEERDTLQRWTRRAKSSQALVKRGRIVLACAAGSQHRSRRAGRCVAGDGGQVAATVCGRAVGRAVRRAAPRCAANDRDAQIEAVIVATLERRRPTLPTGRGVMAKSLGCRSRRYSGSGGRSGSSRTW